MFIVSEILTLSPIWEENYLPSQIQEHEVISIDFIVSKGQVLNIHFVSEFPLEFLVSSYNKNSYPDQIILERLETSIFNKRIQFATYSKVSVIFNNSVILNPVIMSINGEMKITGLSEDTLTFSFLLSGILILSMIFETLQQELSRLNGRILSLFTKRKGIGSIQRFVNLFRKLNHFSLILSYEMDKFPLSFITGLAFLVFVLINPNQRFFLMNPTANSATVQLLSIWGQPFTYYWNWVILVVIVSFGCLGLWYFKEDTKELMNDLSYPFSRSEYISATYLSFAIYYIGIMLIGPWGILTILTALRFNIYPLFLPTIGFFLLFLSLNLIVYMMGTILHLTFTRLGIFGELGLLGILFIFVDLILGFLGTLSAFPSSIPFFSPNNILLIINTLTDPVSFSGYEFISLLLAQSMILASFLIFSMQIMKKYQLH